MAPGVGLVDDLLCQPRAGLHVLLYHHLERLPVHLVLETHRAVIRGQVVAQPAPLPKGEALLTLPTLPQKAQVHGTRHAYGPAELLTGELVEVVVEGMVEVVPS